jgi:hypothetical protein
MTDFNAFSDRLAAQQIRERVADAERTRATSPTNGRRRPHGRHGLAMRLHHLADRLDT